MSSLPPPKAKNPPPAYAHWMDISVLQEYDARDVKVPLIKLS